jgi:hypothetical protein
MTYKLAGLLYNNDTVTVVTEPDCGVSTRSTAANHSNVPRNGLAAVGLRLVVLGRGCYRGREAAKTYRHTGERDVLHLGGNDMQV